MGLDRPEKVIEQLRSIIAKRGRSPAGALLTFVLRHTQASTVTIAGRILFSDDQLHARASIRHPKLSLLEEWVAGAEGALERIQAVLSGTGVVDTTAIPGEIRYTQVEESDRLTASEAGWKEWRFTSELPRAKNLGEIEVPSEPLIAPRTPPFVDGAHAIKEWLYNDPEAWIGERRSSSWEVVTILPDTRIRITRAKWEQSLLGFDVEINVPSQAFEIQVLYGGSATTRHEILVAKLGRVSLEVPEGTKVVHVFVLDSWGELLSHQRVSPPANTVSAPRADVSEEERTRAELLAGENAIVEFKPFVDPKDQQKEAELIKTVVAFLNTDGGRLYVGVDDSGVPQGPSELRRISKRSDESVEPHLKALVERLDNLFRANVKPPPKCSLKVHDKEGRPVIIVEVAKGDQPPYATHLNEYFVRHGSSSMRPDPSELRRLMLSGNAGAAPWIVSGSMF